MNCQIKIIIYLFCLITFSSCYNNGICFDPINNTVKSIEGVSITDISIQRDNGSSITLNNTNTEMATEKIKINSTEINGYEATIYGQVFKKNGELFPNSDYKILNYSVGDADVGRIQFKTDSMGNPTAISQLCCI